MILVIAGAFEFYRLAVKKESFVGIETNSADAENRFDPVSDRAVTLYAGDRAIEIWLLDRPERGMIEGSLRFKCECRPGRNRSRFRLGRGDYLSIRIHDLSEYATISILIGIVLHLSRNRDQRVIRAPQLGANEISDRKSTR